ncbi:MAG: ankyrin repeat domain-containing protein [Chloroflexota bacterium]
MTSYQELTQDVIGEFVQAAHFDLNKVKALHQQHPAVLNARWDKYNETALEASAHMGRADIARYLLTAGVPIEICVAAMLGLEDEVSAFLQADPSLRNSTGAHDISLMYHAALSGNTNIADMMLQLGNVNGMDAALHGATRFGRTDMVAWLLKNGATNLQIKNFDAKTPLQVAIENNLIAIAELLRQHGATE